MARHRSVRVRWASWLGSVLGSVLLTAALAPQAVADPAVLAVPELLPLVSVQQDPPSWGLDRIDQRELPLDEEYHYASTASRVTVYVVDSGIRGTHTEFGGRVAPGPDFIDPNGAAADCFGHGTHVAATIGGRTFGVAKGVRLVPVRTLDCAGAGPDDDLVRAVDWITAHAVRPAVVNMSLRADRFPDPALDDAVRRSVAAGITYVVAAGNDHRDACSVSPADTPEAITVAAVDGSGTRPEESDFGRCVDLFAPGVDIPSATDTGDTATASMSGTSMATAYVSGAAALYLAGHPAATPAEVRAALTTAATRGAVHNAGPGSPNALVYTGDRIGYPG